MIGVLALLLAVLIWGVQPLVVKLVLGVFSVESAALVRSAVAAAFFGLVALLARRGAGATASGARPPRRKVALWLLVGGVGLALGNVLWNASLTRTTVGASSVLQIGGNAVIVLYGILILHEPRNCLRITGLGLSLGGMFLICWNGQDLAALAASRYFQGNVLALVSGIPWSLCAIAQKAAVPGRSSVSVAAPIFAISTVVCGAFAVSQPVLVAPFSPVLLLALIATGLVGMGLGNVLFTEAMRTTSASAGAAALAACPLISLVCAAVVLHEPLSGYLLAGAPLTCLGVAATILTEPAANRMR